MPASRFPWHQALFEQLHHRLAAEIGGHQDDRITKINFTPFTVAHKSPVKNLIEQVHYIAVRFFHFVQQHHTVGTLSDSLGQYTTLPIPHITGENL
jgi:hypothetical protein